MLKAGRGRGRIAREDPRRYLMRTVEFETDLRKRGSLDIPPEVAAQLPVPGHARVILILGDAEDDADWRLLTSQQFLRSYSDEDALYDEYDKQRAG